MKTPRVCLRITAYHMVIASSVPLILNQGALGSSCEGTMPASSSCLRVAT